jgi:MoaA/NifB/PqqE/SkfB family radical SAM enzyme
MSLRLTPYVFHVDVVGTCNLRCPSCPIGNIQHNVRPQGAITTQALDEIVRKAKREFGYVAFHLYNWTEPLLHPNIGDLIRAVTKHGVACHLSTNLNLGKRIDEVAQAKPTSVRVSVSGFFQDVYSQTHKKGDIEKVKNNMMKLSTSVAEQGGHTDLAVYFHRYLGNHIDELEMRSFSRALGYGFDAGWAYMMPLEKNIEFAEHGIDSEKLSKDDKDLINKLALPLAEAIEASRRTRLRDCSLRANQYALDLNGDVSLCCAVYGADDRVIGNYLTEPHAVLLEKKYAHSTCKKCMQHGLHVLHTYSEAKTFDALALRNVSRHFPDASLGASRATARKRTLGRLIRGVRRGVRNILR